LGQTGIMQGMDYRGVPVIAAVCAVNDSPWFLVAKIGHGGSVCAAARAAVADRPARGRPARGRERGRRRDLAASTRPVLQGAVEGGEALRESEERFRRVFEEGPIGMAMLDETFRFIQVNPAFSSMLGYSMEELRTMAFTDITHPDHIQRDVEHMRRLLRGELSMYSTEKRYVASPGKNLLGTGASECGAKRDRSIPLFSCNHQRHQRAQAGGDGAAGERGTAAFSYGQLSHGRG